MHGSSLDGVSGLRVLCESSAVYFSGENVNNVVFSKLKISF